MRHMLTATLFLSCLIGAGNARTEDRDPCGAGQVCASDPASVVRAMEKAGLKPKLDKDNLGDPMIESDEAAYHFDVYFYGCKQNKNCDSLRFEVGFAKEAENTAELANLWNRSKRFLQASVSEDGRFLATYDLATIGGVNERNFGDVLDWWTTMLGELAKFFREELKLDEKPKAETKGGSAT
jgi:hypothetical protein